jgi:probable rRNA maturation factor
MQSDIPDISITITVPEWDPLLPDGISLIEQAARVALDTACPGLGPVGIAIVLADDAMLRDLNHTWRGKDAPTNVLSFPATDTEEGMRPEPPFPGVPLELGDIVMARETCEREALEQGKSLSDHVRHLTIHGVLHLLGYDHEADDEAERMEGLETRILAGLGVADPYRDKGLS